jgi:glucose dehydrogenase
MARDPRVLLFVGIKNAVVALDEKTGYEVWRLDPETGAFIWHNELKGLGRGLLSLASTRAPGPQSNLQAIAAVQAAEAAAAAAAAG